MIIDDRARADLLEAAERALGPRGAEVLMAHLPPVGWADVATKHDLDLRFPLVDQRFDAMERWVKEKFDAVDKRFDAMEGQFKEKFDAVDKRFGAVDERLGRLEIRMDGLSRSIVTAVVGSVFTATSLAFAAAHFT